MMKRKHSLLICVVLAGLLSCKQPAQNDIKPIDLAINDPRLHLLNGSLYYQDALFTGQLVGKWNDSTCGSVQQYREGKQEGSELLFYENGKRESVRWFTGGEKDSIHSGWWSNGKPRFEYHFSMGVYNGPFREWYENGNPLQEIMYDHGNEVSGKGWRENGKPYMNFIVKNGRRYGLVNANLCFTVADEQGMRK